MKLVLALESAILEMSDSNHEVLTKRYNYMFIKVKFSILHFAVSYEGTLSVTRGRKCVDIRD